MKKIIKQVVGIDVAQKELVVSLGRMFDDWSPEVYSNKTFANTAKGFLALSLWVKQMTRVEGELRFVMEATGVYHEQLAYFLEEKGYCLSIRSVIIPGPWKQKQLLIKQLPGPSRCLDWKESSVTGNALKRYLKA